MKELDPGHMYEFENLDNFGCNQPQVLYFVKRLGPKFPGNRTGYSGTNLQSVIRACLKRIYYLQNQKYCLENRLIIFALRSVLWLLEFRAARYHHKFYWHSAKFAENEEMCKRCGHTFCNKF